MHRTEPRSTRDDEQVASHSDELGGRVFNGRLVVRLAGGDLSGPR